MGEIGARTADEDTTSVRLESTTSSASAARHFVTDALTGRIDPDVIDIAVLLVSEVVTNAVLHAGSEIELTVAARDDTVRVEVADDSAVAPARKHYSEEAGTGRGLLLVEALAAGWGTVPRGDGKVVWFEVVATRPELVEVHLLGVPLDIYRLTTEHNDELMREFALIRDRDPAERRDVPGQLLDVIDELQNRYNGFTAAARSELQAAVDRNDPTVDVVYSVPRDVASDVEHLDELLDAADGYCRSGSDLLTLASAPETVSFRKWFLGEFVRQCAGEAPQPWAAR